MKQAATTLLRSFSRLTGAGVVLCGLLIIVSWHLHWRSILQVVPESKPMQYNTALCFILCGVAMISLGTVWSKMAKWLGGAASAFSVLTLWQYVAGNNFGLDLLFFKPYFQVGTGFPGRMSPLAAFCFAVIGCGLALGGSKKPWAQRLTVTALLACVVCVISGMALVGYVFHIDEAYGWGAYSRMALNTAALSLWLSVGLLIWAWQCAQKEKVNFLRWLPIVGSVTLMAMIIIVSATNMAELKRATRLRKHSFEVILAIQSYEENLIDMQRGVRGYISLGDTNALAAYEESAKIEPQQFRLLAELTQADPTQQKRVKDLMLAMQYVITHDQRVITIANTEGLAAALKSDKAGESRAVFGDARNILKALSHEEQNLLGKRDAEEQADSNNTQRLLIFGRILAAILLLLANYLASRELRHRRQIEVKLREMTTLQNAVVNSADYAIIALRPDGIVRVFNPAAERMLGYSAAEIVGKVTPMLWRDPVEVALQAEKMSRELGRPVKADVEILTTKSLREKADEYEVTYIRKNGERFPVYVSLTTLADDSGKVTGILGVIADITKRKFDEAALRDSETRFRGAFDDAPIGMALVSTEGRWLKVNRALCRMLGYSEAQLLATDFQTITHTEDLENDLGFVRQTLAKEIPSYQMEKRYFHKNGTTVSVMLSVSLVCDQAGKPLYFISQIEDITERIQQDIYRERMIAELQGVLAQVKTLSGMIPICGWCKSIRSDQGYWQSVEQFVRARTDATFSHGVCPDCSEKMKAEIFKRGDEPAAV